MKEKMSQFLDSLSDEDIDIIKKWLDDREKKMADNFKLLTNEINQKYGYGIGDISYFKEFNNQDIVFYYNEYLIDRQKNEINDYIHYYGKLFISKKDDTKIYEVVRFKENFTGNIYNLDRDSMLKVPNFMCLKYNILDFMKRRDF